MSHTDVTMTEEEKLVLAEKTKQRLADNGNMTNDNLEVNHKAKGRKISGSDSEEGFLSTSPDSTNGDCVLSKAAAPSKMTTTNCIKQKKDAPIINVAPPLPPPICLCINQDSKCVTMKSILDSFKAPLSEEQAWAVIYQFISLYRKIAKADAGHIFNELEIPDSIENINFHNDGTVHCSWNEADRKLKESKIQAKNQSMEAGTADVEYEMDDDTHAQLIASHKKIVTNVAVIVYTALDYNLQVDEQCQMSQELEDLLTYMTADETEDDCDDEGIVDTGFKSWDKESISETKDFDFVLEACKNHIKPTVPEDHYKAVCRALAMETFELQTFLAHVLSDAGAANLHLKANTQTSKQELAKLGFSDWARFWIQVIDELRRGVRLKKSNYERTPIEYQLTPYEILMEDIRSKKYQLRKVMVNGDIPPRVKKDAHALILEFIRSRPPLKKASERKLLPPVKRTPSPREQLMDSIRKGQTLKHIQPPPQPHLKDRLLPPTIIAAASSATLASLKLQENIEANTMPRSKQRLIKVDFSLLQDDDNFFDESATACSSTSTAANMGVCSQPKMPPYPIGGYMVSDATTTKANTSALTTRALRRTTYDLATQCESRRASMRRHTIVGCQSNFDETHSMPSSRPESRQSDVNAITSTTKQANCSNTQPSLQQTQQLKSVRSQSPSSNAATTGGDSSSNCSRSSSSIGPWNKSFMDEKTWQERGDDRLSLTLEEIVHIRSVMTKAELEGLPVGVRVKEDVEKRKVCFLCLRTRFSIFGPWGIMCKLCQRTVCSKCYTKMRIPSDHFRNVPLVMISPSLLASPAGSSTPSPSHHAHHTHSSSTGNILDETFPKSLIERLMRTESENKTRNSVGSAPSSPKHQRSNMSTPGNMAVAAAGQAVEALHHNSSVMTSSYTTGNTLNKSAAAPQANNKHISIMSRSMEGPRSLPANSPARPHSNSSTLDRKSRFPRAFGLSSSGTHLSQDQKENMRGEQVPVCNDCKGLVMEITRSSKQTRSSARNRALQNLTLDLSPVYK